MVGYTVTHPVYLNHPFVLLINHFIYTKKFKAHRRDGITGFVAFLLVPNDDCFSLILVGKETAYYLQLPIFLFWISWWILGDNVSNITIFTNMLENCLLRSKRRMWALLVQIYNQTNENRILISDNHMILLWQLHKIY